MAMAVCIKSGIETCNIYLNESKVKGKKAGDGGSKEMGTPDLEHVNTIIKIMALNQQQEQWQNKENDRRLIS